MWDISQLGCTLDKQNFTWLMCVYFNKEQIDIFDPNGQKFLSSEFQLTAVDKHSILE